MSLMEVVIGPHLPSRNKSRELSKTGIYRFLSLSPLELYVPAISELLNQPVNHLQSRPRYQNPFSGSPLMGC